MISGKIVSVVPDFERAKACLPRDGIGPSRVKAVKAMRDAFDGSMSLRDAKELTEIVLECAGFKGPKDISVGTRLDSITESLSRQEAAIRALNRRMDYGDEVPF